MTHSIDRPLLAAGFGWRSMLALAAALATTYLPKATLSAAEPVGKQHVYIGTYTGGTSKGVYHALFDPASGELSKPELAAEVGSPSWITTHPSGKFLYTVDREGDPNGGVLAYAIDRASGKLTPLGKKAACGDAPCHMSVDRTGRCLLVASYGGGSVAALPIKPDGSLGDATEIIKHGPADKKYEPGDPHKPKGHSINVDADNHFAVAADLGLDQLLVYRLDAEHAKLTPHDPPFLQLKSGGGPRHFAFHPNGKFAYTNLETTSEIVALAYDPAKGKFTELQTLSTLPADFKENNSTAEIQVHPNGRAVYVADRGLNAIAMFAIDPATGKLTSLGQQSTGGKVPRNFAIDPSGKFLLAENQDSNTIVMFRIEADGKLSATGQSVELGAPVCIKFVAVE